MSPSTHHLSAYDQWKLEDDERFYATFPQARPSSYYPTTTTTTPTTTTTTTATTTTVATAAGPHPFTPHSAPLSQISLPLPLSKESALSPALLYDYLPQQSSPTSPVFSDGHDAKLASLASTSLLLKPHAVVPSQPAQPSHRPSPAARSFKTESIMDHLPPPDKSGPEPSSSRLPSTSHAYLISQQEASPSVTADRYGTSTPDHWSPTSTSPGSSIEPDTLQRKLSSPHHPALLPSTQSSEETPSPSPLCDTAIYDHEPQSLDHPPRHPLPTRTITPTSNPYPHPALSVTSSPNPAGSRRTVLRKPPLACHFCRGRKIACGAPDPSSTDRTCNQCERRSLKCEYPLESRRGMRKKKSTPPISIVDPLDAKSLSPKAKVGRRPKASLE